MLQEKLYPGWARPVRRWWQRGYNRIILFWIVVFISSFVVIFVIATDYIQWDKLNRDFLPTNELSRAFLASFILVMDLMIVMQVSKAKSVTVKFRMSSRVKIDMLLFLLFKICKTIMVHYNLCYIEIYDNVSEICARFQLSRLSIIL